MIKEERIELIRQALLEPPPVDQVRWRVRTKIGNNKAYVLAYIDARYVMERLDSVFGVFGWNRIHRIEGGNHICQIRIDYLVEWENEEANTDYYTVQKVVEDIAEPTDIEAAKGGASDAFKRAAVNLGISRVLYTLGDTRVTLNEYGTILDSEMTRLKEEVLKPAFKKFRYENHLPESMDDSKEKSEETAKEIIEILDPDILATSMRAKYYARMLVLAGTATSGLLDGIVKKHGKWNGLDILGKLSYIITLKAHVDALEQQAEKEKE